MTNNSTSSAAEKGRNGLSPGLYLVSTPIGNIRDITLRALDILKSADVIACEDTRVTGKLRKAYDIDTPLFAYHDHNADKTRPKLIARMQAGEVVALVSDAGTPLVSDPGYKLVRDCREQGIDVTAAPGASAVLTGLVLSALPADRFTFAGFLPVKGGARRTAIGEAARAPGALIFYETAPRLTSSLKDMAAVLGEDRQAAVARELTKKFEEVRAGTLGELYEHYKAEGPPKGEIVVLIGPAPAAETADYDDAAIDRLLGEALGTMGMSVRDAAAWAAEETGQPRRKMYARALALGSETGGD